MDLMDVGVNLLKKQLGGSASSSQISSALSGLFGESSGGLDISSIVSKMMDSGSLAGLATSWLGDGENDEAGSSQISDIFGADKISKFASALNIDDNTAVNSLKNVIPQLVDKGSSGGSLLDSVGGIGGAASMLKNLF